MIESEFYVKNIAPCPFCGNSDKIVCKSENNYNELVEEHGIACLTLECKTCGLTMYEYPFEKSDEDRAYDNMLRALIKRWNTRRYVYEFKEN